ADAGRAAHPARARGRRAPRLRAHAGSPGPERGQAQARAGHALPDALGAPRARLDRGERGGAVRSAPAHLSPEPPRPSRAAARDGAPLGARRRGARAQRPRHGGLAMSLALALQAALLRLAPRAFRERFGPELLDVAERVLADERRERGPAAALLAGARQVVDLACNVLRLQL